MVSQHESEILVNIEGPPDSDNQIQSVSSGRKVSVLSEHLTGPPRNPSSFSQIELDVLQTVNDCFKNWHEPWKATFMADEREFKTVYELMDGIMHYELLITNNRSPLSTEKINAIAQAVARLIDYGNAILNLDMVIRINDDNLSRIDPTNLTTIELFHAHVKANNLRAKLLYDYFKKDRSTLNNSMGEEDISSLLTPSDKSLGYSQSFRSVYITNQNSSLGLCSDRAARTSVSSINSYSSMTGDGRRTPQQIELKLAPQPNMSSHLEISHMIATINSESFTLPKRTHTRLTILPDILNKIDDLLSNPPTHEKTANCFIILDALLDAMEKLPEDSRRDESQLIATCLLEQLVRRIYIEDRENLMDLSKAHWTTYLISLLKLIRPTEFNQFLKHFNSGADLAAFLKDFFFLVKQLILSEERSTTRSKIGLRDSSTEPSVFPEHWIEMKLVASATFLNSLTHLFQVIKQNFATNLQIWSCFIDCLVNFLSQSVLKPTRNMSKVSHSIIAENLRQLAADTVVASWNSISPDQRQSMLEELIEPLLRACMTLNRGQRVCLLPILYDMTYCDYVAQYLAPKSQSTGNSSSTVCDPLDSFNNLTIHQNGYICHPTNRHNSQMPSSESLPYLSLAPSSEDGTVLTKFTHLIITKLHSLIMGSGLGDQQFKTELCSALSIGDKEQQQRQAEGNLCSQNQFVAMAKQTADLIAEFMQICLDLRASIQLSYKHLNLVGYFKLILFFRDKVDVPDLYFSYLYKLFALHHKSFRYVEAGFTLLEHAKTISFTSEPIDQHSRIVFKYFNSPNPLNDSASLKIFLYNTLMEYFDLGEYWEGNLSICRELIDYYQFKTFNYVELAEVLRRMSGYLDRINNSHARSVPEYFRVTFYGNGFPERARNTTMIYRGKPYEKLSDFQSAMLNKFHDASILTSLSKPNDSLLEDQQAKFLQINACSPVIDLAAKFPLDTNKIKESVLSFHRHNECDKFSFSRRITRPTNLSQRSRVDHPAINEFADMWRERTTMTTNRLPGILPFFPVFLIETSIMSPIESAIEDLKKTNDRLSRMVSRFLADKDQVEDIRLLSQLLLGILDAAVNGGISRYEEAFLRESSADILNESASANVSPDFADDITLSVRPRLARLSDGAKTLGVRSHGSTDTIGGKRDTDPLVRRLKRLIAEQLPLLDKGVRIHRDRVADIMRPQHEHLEASLKKLKNHIMTNYYRYLPPGYGRSNMRSFRNNWFESKIEKAG